MIQQLCYQQKQYKPYERKIKTIHTNYTNNYMNNTNYANNDMNDTNHTNMDTNDTDYLDYLISLGNDEDPDDDYDPYELNNPFRVLLVGGPTRRQPPSSQELILTHGVFCGTERLVPGTNSVAPAYVMVTYFKNMEEIDRYIIEIESIRSNWVSFVETYDHLHPMSPVVMGRFNLHQHEWKLQVESFICEWGRDMVPHDMRWAYSGTGPLSLSDWPRNEDVDQATFDEVRNFLNERE